MKYTVGQIVQHLKFGYRGVVYDVDPEFNSTDEWYEQVAKSRPPKDQPWYHVLVHLSETCTYAAQTSLEADASTEPIKHPFVLYFFKGFANGKYDRNEHPWPESAE